MKTMTKVAVVAGLLAALTIGLNVQPASAGNGNFWGGFGAGTATGLVVGTVIAPRYYPPAYHYAPQPVYVYPPAPVCREVQTEAYWRQVPVMDPGGFTTYRSEYVPATVQRLCQ